MLRSQTLINQLWQLELNYPDTVSWSASALNGAYLITTGNTFNGISQKTNIATTKTDQGGAVVWQAEYNGPLSGFDYGAALAVDAAGNVFIAGASHASDAYSFDVVVIKYNAAGVQQWATTFDGEANANDIPSAILLTGTDIYVCAASIGAASNYDYLLLKLNAAGAVLWNARYDYADLDDIPGHIAAAAADIIVSGASQSDTANWDYTSLKYNSSGTLINTKRTAAPGYGFDRPSGLVVDVSGNFYISGYAFNGTDYDMRTIKLDDDLSTLWSKTENGGAQDGCNAICMDDGSNIYIAGFSENSAGNKCMQIIKYDSSGTKLWTKTLQNAGSDIRAEVTGITFNSENNKLIATGFYEYPSGKKTITTFALKTANGNINWKKDYPNIAESIDVPTGVLAKNNYVWVNGRRTVEDTTRYVTVKYEMYERVDIFDEDSIYPINYVIISFHPTVVNHDFVNNTQKQYENLSATINTTTYNQVLPFLKGRNQQFTPKALKIYKRMVVGDTISISRLGENVVVPKLWADFVVSIDTTVDINHLIDSLTTKSYIYRGAFKDYVAVQFELPNDSLFFIEQAGLEPIGALGEADINIEPAWEIYDLGGTPDINIGIYDGGINWGHEDFGFGEDFGGLGGSKIIGGKNYVDGVDIYSEAHNDETGHGTACASIPGALRNNIIGIAGIAGGDVDDEDNPGCSLYAMKIFGTSAPETGESATTSEISEAVAEGAISPPYGFGLHVSNHSYGVLLDFEDVPFDESDYDGIYLQYGFKQMFLNQSLCAVASGNVNPGLEIEEETAVYPASFPDYWVIKTGANDASGGRAIFSVFNNLIDLIAPGTGDLYAFCSPFDDDAYTSLAGGIAQNGTSFAAPHIAGVAGLMMSYVNNFPGAFWNDLAPADVEELMQRYITEVDPVGYDFESGHGRLNAGAIFEVIELPNYQVRHYLPNVNTASATKISDDEVFFLSEPYGALSAGLYVCDQYELTMTVPHDIGDADLLNWWDLDASNNVWGYTDYVINPLPEIVIESCNETSATLTGYFYFFDYVATYPFNNVDKWYPCSNTGTTQMAYTLHLFDPTPTLAIDDLDSSGDVTIYPNPGTDYFEIIDNSTDQKDYETIQITDLTGKIIIEDKIQFSNNSLTYRSLIAKIPPGIYLISLQSPQKNVSLKWVKL